MYLGSSCFSVTRLDRADHGVLPSRGKDPLQGRFKRPFAVRALTSGQGGQGAEIGEAPVDEHGQPVADLRHLTDGVRDDEHGLSCIPLLSR